MFCCGLHLEEEAVGADDEVGFAVAVEVADRRTVGVAGDVAPGEVADLPQDHPAGASVFAIAPPGGVLRIGEDIEAPVTVPIDDR